MPVDPESNSTFVSLPRCWWRHVHPPPRPIATGAGGHDRSKSDRESHQRRSQRLLTADRELSRSWDLRLIFDRQPFRSKCGFYRSRAPRFRKLIHSKYPIPDIFFLLAARRKMHSTRCKESFNWKSLKKCPAYESWHFFSGNNFSDFNDTYKWRYNIYSLRIIFTRFFVTIQNKMSLMSELSIMIFILLLILWYDNH